jgi:hypothetical protein
MRGLRTLDVKPLYLMEEMLQRRHYKSRMGSKGGCSP